MKAAVYKEYGGPDMIHILDVEKPWPKENEVLIKVKACSINDWDWGLLDGSDWINRAMNGRKKPRITILGSDVAGIVEATGPDVKNLKVGDEVFGDLSGKWGGFAEYVCAAEKLLALKPAGMSFEQAAAIPQAAMLAVQGLKDVGRMKAGQKILINGAGGGVGTFGIQIAKRLGVEATGVDSAIKLDMLRALGYDHVIDYKKEDFTKNGQRYDLVVDAKTNRSIFSYMRALNPGGRYVTVGGMIPRLLQVFLFGWIAILVGKRIRIVALKPNKDLEFMKSMFNDGTMKPVIDGPYRLDEIKEAFEKFARGEHKGKLIVVI
ncbi:MAG TPA: NAD(P)-dependent alcohol dehydrogenase [Cyclobacteriaceae bacterium]|nr:NAD(P)-dependent alcohol dehydrogenase [Cyclobacteriaceae bacterium]